MKKIKRLESSNKELQEMLDKAKPWFELSEVEQKQKEKELQKQKDDEAAELSEKKAKKAKKEIEELIKTEKTKKISFDEINSRRTNSSYKGCTVIFYGKVIQVIVRGKIGEIEFVLAVNGDCDHIIYLYCNEEIISPRILEGDYINIIGILKGFCTYEFDETYVKDITMPLIYVNKIIQHLNGLEYFLGKEENYDAGISYQQLLRMPDKYEDKKVKLCGKVIEVMTADGMVDIRLAVNGDYKSIIYLIYNSITTTLEISAQDDISIMGISEGLYTYYSNILGSITLPLVYVDKIEQF